MATITDVQNAIADLDNSVKTLIADFQNAASVQATADAAALDSVVASIGSVKAEITTALTPPPATPSTPPPTGP